MSAQVVAISEQDAQAIAGLAVIASHTNTQATIALDTYAKRMWQAAGLDDPILQPISVSDDWKTLNYSKCDGSELVQIKILEDGYSLSVKKGD